MDLAQNPSVIESFEKLGLSPNEARVYLALLDTYPITGYQLAKNSGILRPVVYEMLNRLVEKGGARIIKSNPDTYIPVEIDEFLKNIEADFSEARKQITQTLSEHEVIDNTDYFWNILGRKNIVNSLEKTAERAKEQILISVQKQSLLDSMMKILEERLKDRVEITIFSFYQLETNGITLYSYRMNSHFKADSIDPDTFLICADGLEAMVVQDSSEKTAKAVFSRNPSLVSTVKERITHQVYLYRIWTFLGVDRLKTLLNDEDRKFYERIDKALAAKHS